MDTEDKQAWCDYGDDAERHFVAGRLFDLGLGGHINPEKKTNPYVHDMFVQFPSDLKTVRTPLFKSMELYGIDPQYAVTFNHKDAERYKELYPNIVVIFDIWWKNCALNIGGQDYAVKDMHFTVAGFLSDIRNAIVKSGSHRIDYTRRVGDTNGNAKFSWVLDARHLQKISPESQA
jgi:hypothetical protein